MVIIQWIEGLEKVTDLQYLEFSERDRELIAFQAEFNKIIAGSFCIPQDDFNNSVQGSYYLAQDYLSTQRIRDIVRTKAYFIDTSHPAKVIILSILNGERNSYIASLNGGLRTYISEMLGPLAMTLCNSCQVLAEDKTEIDIPRAYRYTTIQKYLASEFTVANLPYKVIVDGVIERYL